MDKDLRNHGAVAYDQGPSGYARDLPDVDLSDHGAVAYDQGPSGYTRDLPDVDLSDHGAVAYDQGPSGYTRDLPDVDLSDHGAVAYAPKSETWGTNDEEIAKQMNILMHASYCNNIDQTIPLLNAASLAKVVEHRYRQVANMLENSQYGLGKDEKEKLGMSMYMDFLIINNMISSNTNCLEPIFNPSLYLEQQELTDIFGVLEQYKQDLDNAGVQIPLIDGSTGNPLIGATGKVVTAQETLNYLMSKNKNYEPENIGGKSR